MAHHKSLQWAGPAAPPSHLQLPAMGRAGSALFSVRGCKRQDCTTGLRQPNPYPCLSLDSPPVVARNGQGRQRPLLRQRVQPRVALPAAQHHSHRADTGRLGGHACGAEMREEERERAHGVLWTGRSQVSGVTACAWGPGLEVRAGRSCVTQTEDQC